MREHPNVIANYRDLYKKKYGVACLLSDKEIDATITAVGVLETIEIQDEEVLHELHETQLIVHPDVE